MREISSDCSLAETRPIFRCRILLLWTKLTNIYISRAFEAIAFSSGDIQTLRQDPPAYSYAKTSPSSPASSSTLTTSTLLSPSLLPPYPHRPSSPPPPYSPSSPQNPPSRRLLVVLTVVIMLLSSLTVGITWKHWELMSTIQSQQGGKKVDDQTPASTPPRYTLGLKSHLTNFDAF